MPIMRICGKPRCGTLIPATAKFCELHAARAAQQELLRSAQRLSSEPWRSLYSQPEWKACARRVRRRDNYHCTACGKTHGKHSRQDPRARLTVHHKIPLRVLWQRASEEWETFLELATNEDVTPMVTLCYGCHRTAELELRREITEAGGETFYAPARRPSQRRRRR